MDPADIKYVDFYLINLVAKWDDERLMPFLLKNLEAHSGKSFLRCHCSIEEVMDLIANELRDDKIKKLAKAFQDTFPDYGRLIRQSDIDKAKSILQEFIQVVKKQIESEAPEKDKPKPEKPDKDKPE
ncbi:hypothetical protein ES703_124828 [subsurface metagenome]